jgi:RHH-type proline utilization regulon transcriptional repressor/proline dehydrogenase/delta 1-pyrroline-5-carboxylate dehydrogenase
VPLDGLRQQVRAAWLEDEQSVVDRLRAGLKLDARRRHRIEAEAAGVVEELRARGRPGLMETFLAEYGLSTEEGVALMCLAEALLRVPDTPTIDALIKDKIAAADWGRHLGLSSSPLVNASTWALMLTGKVLGEKETAGWDVTRTTRRLIGRAGEPVVRSAIAQAMRVLGHQFVLGRNIDEALERAQAMEERGYTYSYDMLGEAARTAGDAQRYFLSYSKAISAIAERCDGGDVRSNPGISVKLSALHPRYEQAKRARVLDELVPRVAALALHAKNAGMGFNIDAEEAERLDLSLDVIEAVLRSPDLRRWDGFGVVVQAYGRRAAPVLDWLYALAGSLDRRLMVRLVKGAYWDSEIKLAQAQGLAGYPVFTRKLATDLSYMACAETLLAMTDRIYPQFATHNAHSVTAVLELARGQDSFELQRLHGMGEMLHERIRQKHGNRCRIYAPVGVHEDLLAYLVRRLLENGANSSFVHQILDDDIPVAHVVRDPVDAVAALPTIANPRIPAPPDLYGPHRRNAPGWSLSDPTTLAALDSGMAAYRTTTWHACAGPGPGTPITNPADRGDGVGEATEADAAAIDQALRSAGEAFAAWCARPVTERAACLDRIAELYEAHAAELMALCAREAGKTRSDAVAELREAIDFCRYYAALARASAGDRQGRGLLVCISPWNFPLAIFTGQVVAALVAGNTVIAKPAEQTPLIAARAVGLMHEAGIPGDVLHLLCGDGARVGGTLVSDPRVAGVVFTGSTETARRIERTMADSLAPDAPLIAETGGINAMIVDSTALPEQAVRDVLASAFQSAGQRCSALRVLCVQEDVAPTILRMLQGALRELSVGDPWDLATDVGPVIDDEAKAGIEAHCAALDAKGRLIARLPLGPEHAAGSFVAPAIYRLDSLDELDREIFGPILHVVTFKASQLNRLVERLNAKGYGLTLGIHSRVDGRVRQITERARIGNIYVNRNQIGAVVGVQPFGGEGLSGTGPKAGGPHYLHRLTVAARPDLARADLAAPGIPVIADTALPADLETIAAQLRAAQDAWDRRRDRLRLLARAVAACPEPARALAEKALAAARPYVGEPLTLPGPSGESNRLSLHGRGLWLCLGVDADTALRQVVTALATGNTALAARSEAIAALLAAVTVPHIAHCFAWNGELASLLGLPDLAGVALSADQPTLRSARQLLAAREGPLAQLVTDPLDAARFVTERTLSIDITAAGGNVGLLAADDP